jgi:hypothetical protein
LDVGACGLESPARFFLLTPGFSPVTQITLSNNRFNPDFALGQNLNSIHKLFCSVLMQRNRNQGCQLTGFQEFVSFEFTRRFPMQNPGFNGLYS